jgi:magnesium transporter
MPRLSRKVLQTLLKAAPLRPARSEASRARARRAGLPPGALVYTGERTGPVTVTVVSYDATSIEETRAATPAEALAERGRRETTWIDVVGLHDVATVKQIGEAVGLDTLLLEDILNVRQRPKLETRDETTVITVQMFLYEQAHERVRHEQISIVLTRDTVLTFQEAAGDVFEPVRARLREGRGRIRAWGPDYLAYALFDMIVDHYFVVLERFSERVDDLEEVVVVAEGPEIAHAIHRLRRENLRLRRSIWPLREVVSELSRKESLLIRERMQPFLRDLYEHVVEAIDTVEMLRDTLGGLLDVHLTSISNRMNEVMKVLAIIATIFVPLTFLSGVYGMNFDYMPELRARWGYPAVLSLMFAVFLGMLVYFRRRRWI